MKKKLFFGNLIVIVLIGIFAGHLFIYGSDDDDDDDEYRNKSKTEKSSGFFSGWFENDESVPKVTSAVYSENCSECHFAFQPALLPKRSWQRMMQDNELEDHFGEYLEFEAPVKTALLDYLVQNAADVSQSKISQRIMRSIGPNEQPLEITKTNFIIRKHDEIPKRMIIDNPDVNTLSNCMACHKTANEGNFHEDDVEIPNYPNFDS